MRHLFSTKVRIILVLAVLLAAALAVVAGVSEQSLPEVVVQGILTPFKAAGNALTQHPNLTYSKYLYSSFHIEV